MKVFLLDNFDSFTYNIVHLLHQLGAEPVVKRNTETDISRIKKLSPSRIIISPGPMRPENHNLILELIDRFFEKIPILGICLGMQAINLYLGGRLRCAPEPVHGKRSLIENTGEGIFRGLPGRFYAARYHSLMICDLPPLLKETAVTEARMTMAVQHVRLPVFGLQFHPESYLSEYGAEIISNFLAIE